MTHIVFVSSVHSSGGKWLSGQVANNSNNLTPTNSITGIPAKGESRSKLVHHENLNTN
jgi:hypothetical protein